VTVAEPKQLDAAVRLVLSGPNGTVLRESWPDLWDTAHNIVRSADSEDLWQSLCRLSDVFSAPAGSVVTLLRPDDYEYPPERRDSQAADLPDATVAASAAATDFVQVSHEPILKSEAGAHAGTDPIGAERREPATKSSRPASETESLARRLSWRALKRSGFYALLAIASLAFGATVAMLLLHARPSPDDLERFIRSRTGVALLILGGFALAAWAVIDWASLHPRGESESADIPVSPRPLVRRAAPFGAALLVASAGVLLLRASESPRVVALSTSSASVAQGQKQASTPDKSQAASYAPPSGASGNRPWALPLAANIIIQGAGLIRAPSQLATQITSATPIVARPVASPIAAANVTQPPQSRFLALPPEPTLVRATETAAAALQTAPTVVATPVLALAAPQLLAPAGFPTPPFALHRTDPPGTTTTAPATAPNPAVSTVPTDAPTVTLAVDVRSALPGGVAPSSTAQATNATAPIAATVAAAGPTVAAAHLRFGTPPPSPR
jgi:hypothetical protein